MLDLVTPITLGILQLRKLYSMTVHRLELCATVVVVEVKVLIVRKLVSVLKFYTDKKLMLSDTRGRRITITKQYAL